jgi:hypothetical protein
VEPSPPGAVPDEGPDGGGVGAAAGGEAQSLDCGADSPKATTLPPIAKTAATTTAVIGPAAGGCSWVSGAAESTGAVTLALAGMARPYSDCLHRQPADIVASSAIFRRARRRASAERQCRLDRTARSWSPAVKAAQSLSPAAHIVSVVSGF